MEVTASSIIKFVSDGATPSQTGDWLFLLFFLLAAILLVSVFLLKRNKIFRSLIGG